MPLLLCHARAASPLLAVVPQSPPSLTSRLLTAKDALRQLRAQPRGHQGQRSHRLDGGQAPPQGACRHGGGQGRGPPRVTLEGRDQGCRAMGPR
jgi:hypothetical protein